MNGILPLDYMLLILAENGETYKKEIATAVIKELKRESLIEIKEVVEDRLNGN